MATKSKAGEIKIEKGIPLPDGSGYGKTKYPFEGMEIGDSFVADVKVRNVIRNWALKLGTKYVSHRIGDGKQCRVWRVK